MKVSFIDIPNSESTVYSMSPQVGTQLSPQWTQWSTGWTWTLLSTP